jgi:dihydroorotase
MTRITLPRPDDWHLHLRDGPALAAVVGHSARRFARAIVMPNLKPPVTTTEQALAYRERILYLTDRTPPEEIRRARDSGRVHAVKLYPAGATTHSDAGVTDIARTYPTLEAMAEVGMPLLVHGEVTDPKVDVFDREAAFIDRHLAPLVERVPKLKVVMEHITTARAVDFVRQAPPRVAATITPHHLLLNRNALFQGGLRPDHRRAVLEAAVSGEPKFFLGTDSAPHPRGCKLSACGCAGIYSAHAALELYAEAFEAAGALDRLPAFAAEHGPDFYGLPRNTARVTLEKAPWTVPEAYAFGDDTLVPLRAGERVQWRLVGMAI